MMLQRRQLYGAQKDPVWSGLAAMWEFNGEAYDAISKITLTQIGTVSYVPGKIKQCAHFNGGYFMHPDAFDLPTYSISFWINISSTSGSIAGLINTTVGTVSYGLRLIDSKQLILRDVSHIWGMAYADLPGNVWIHFCIAANPATYKIYVNYGNVSISGIPGTFVTKIPTYIGLDNYDGKRVYKGYLEQLAVWNRELSPDEVLRLYNQGNGLAY